MVISPRRPVTEEFLEFESEVKKRATEVYGYVWPKKAEVYIEDLTRVSFLMKFMKLAFGEFHKFHMK